MLDYEISVLPSIVSPINWRLDIKSGFYTLPVENKAANESVLELMDGLGVRNNIEAFGGDPENIVAVGQSVGAMAIGLHLVSYGGNQGVPFHKAM